MTIQLDAEIREAVDASDPEAVAILTALQTYSDLTEAKAPPPAMEVARSRIQRALVAYESNKTKRRQPVLAARSSAPPGVVRLEAPPSPAALQAAVAEQLRRIAALEASVERETAARGPSLDEEYESAIRLTASRLNAERGHRVTDAGPVRLMAPELSAHLNVVDHQHRHINGIVHSHPHRHPIGEVAHDTVSGGHPPLQAALEAGAEADASYEAGLLAGRELSRQRR